MARIRQFKPGFFTDDKVGRLSRDARLFFFGVLSEADDEGRLVDSPKRLAGVVFPFDDDVTAKKVERWLDELVAQQMVVRYTHEGGRFLYVRKFKEHQRMSHPTPSNLPPPGSGSPEKLRSDSGKTPAKPTSEAGEPPEGFAPEGVLVFEGVFEGVSVSEGVSVPSSSKPQSRRASSSDDDDGESERTTLDLLVERRMALTERSTHQINNPIAYRAKVVASVEAEIGYRARDLLAKGLSPGEVVDELLPLPGHKSSVGAALEPDLYAAVEPLEYTELEDGTVMIGRAAS